MCNCDHGMNHFGHFVLIYPVSIKLETIVESTSIIIGSIRIITTAITTSIPDTSIINRTIYNHMHHKHNTFSTTIRLPFAALAGCPNFEDKDRTSFEIGSICYHYVE
ncbi:hypothetical protein DPMN_172890 [Dreissena polymorpha]|uniref:Uncharacterized protein n=1 Tax=Dreissena polymorpha TaxID=45954 RepID=A0A9D4E340_DREPO|nr:hypothetical protein DPMN_172890 [Dreissena polymorpha]